MNWMDFGTRMFTALPLGAAIGLGRQWRRRMTAYVVSSIGFPGGGVILKDGFSIPGLNTAATLWCTAAVGTLAGLGYPGLAAMGAAGMLSANPIPRPVALLINRTPARKERHGGDCG